MQLVFMAIKRAENIIVHLHTFVHYIYICIYINMKRGKLLNVNITGKQIKMY